MWTGKGSPESEDEPENDCHRREPSLLHLHLGLDREAERSNVEHRNLVNYTHHLCQRLEWPKEATRRVAVATVSTITADLATPVLSSLVSGGCLHILSYEVATDGVRFEEYVRRNPIDVLKIVPAHLGALLEAQLNGAKMLPHRYLILEGSLVYELVDRIRGGAGCEVINHYGPTETTSGH